MHIDIANKNVKVRVGAANSYLNNTCKFLLTIKLSYSWYKRSHNAVIFCFRLHQGMFINIVRHRKVVLLHLYNT